MKINYIPDKEINLENKDLLGAKPYVETLSEIIRKTNTPFTIGLFGGWGVGKSSIIKTIKENFNNDSKSGIEIFTYDAWKYLNDSFRRTFLLNFLEYFNLDTKEIRARFYTNKVKNTTWGISKIIKYQKTNSITYDKTIEPEIFEGIFKETIEQITNNKNYTWKYFKELIGFKKKIEKIVIVIDNIDRCNKDLAFELLLTIKNFLEQKGVIFIIPIDEVEIKKHIKKQGNNPNEFLRKLFNTTVSIKDISENDLFDFAKKLNDDYQLGFSPEIISIVAQQFSKNPRKIIQFLNVLQTEILLAEIQEKTELIPPGSITKNLPFFTKLLIIREEWPELYQVLKNNSYILENIYNKIQNDGENYYIENFEINTEQKNYLRRTNHIKPNHNNFELFFINKDSFKDIPDKTNTLVESNDIEGIKEQLKNKEIEFDELIKFIDEKFEKALKRGEIKTTIVNLISLIFGLAIDKELKKQTQNYLFNSSKFLGGFRSFISSDSIKEILLSIDNKQLLLFAKEYERLYKKLLQNLISLINKGKDSQQLLINFVGIFKDEPEKLKTVSSKFSEYLSTDKEFTKKIIPIIENEVIIENLITSKLIDDYIEKIENNIENEESNQKLELILLYNKIKGLSNEQTNKIVSKLLLFINSVNDYIKSPYWLEILNKFIPNIEEYDALSTNIYNSLSSKQNWLWKQYSANWNRGKYQKTLKIFLEVVTELYCNISDANQENNLITWITQYYNRNESPELVKFTNNLFHDIINRIDVYKWPFAQAIINRFFQVNDWELKKAIANTLNIMLAKTKNDDGLTEQQIQSIFTNYINLFDDDNQDVIINWISDALKNEMLIKHFEVIINNQSDERKFELLELLIRLNKNEIIENVITTILKNIDCDDLESVFDKIENTKVSKDIIIRSIKTVLRNIERESENFECLLENFSVSKFSDNVVHNLIAEKVKNLLATEDNDEILFALRIVDNLNFSDTRKLDAIKTLIRDINESDFQDDDLKFVKKMKKKYK